MKEIGINVTAHPNWFKDEKLLARRVESIVRGIGFEPHQNDNGTWLLDSGNDWSLNVPALNLPSEPNQFSLRYRYQDAFPDEFWSGLKVVLEHILDRRKALG